MMRDDRERARQTDLIVEALSRYGLTKIDEWDPDGGNGLTARLGRWRAIRDSSRGYFYEGDEGELIATVVGAREFGNERVSISFTPDDFDRDSGDEAVPFEDVEPLS